MAVLPIGISGEEGGYQIERSLRFNSADSAYLSWTPASAGNRKTWTWSGWVKRSRLAGLTQILFTASNGSSDVYELRYISDNGASGVVDSLQFTVPNGNALLTTAVHRDPSAWGHVVLSVDTTQATQANRANLYFNGVLLTPSATVGLLLNEDTSINNTVLHSIGRRGFNGTLYLDAYLTEVNFIDGQALDPTSFGEYNADTGVWQPIAYTGTYGTNGFYLNFSDNSTTTALGTDYSGNSNNWTPNNFSVTAGTGNDSLVDTPTLYGTDTGAGGEVRGNYCTWNPLVDRDAVTSTTFSNGNLDAVFPSGLTQYLFGTLPIATSGKWYWEATVTTLSAGAFMGIGFDTGKKQSTANDQAVMYGSSGIKTVYATNTSYGATFTTGDVIGVALNMDSLEVTFYKNGSSQGAITGLTSLSYTPHVQGADSSAVTLNAGQRPFAYAAPSGFKALCTTNLPDPAIADGSQYFNTVLYTGTGSTQSITGLDFQPDLVWIKSRSNVTFHQLADSVRGVTKQLYSNDPAAETTATDRVTSLNSNGFSLGADASGGVNSNTYTFVAWNWKANGSGVSNTDGSITSTVSANPTAGFSIVSYVGTGANATVGHGLGVAPSMVIVKQRDAVTDWYVYHSALAATDFIRLNLTNAKGTNTGLWNSTAPTSTVFSLGGYTEVDANTKTYVAYCFAPVDSYSSFGSYQGNGSSDGPFIYTGFRPKFVMVKRSDSTGGWAIFDAARSTFNVVNEWLYANASDAEYVDTGTPFDFTSNGFKVRVDGTWTSINANGGTYIYAAFAEVPFKLALGR